MKELTAIKESINRLRENLGERNTAFVLWGIYGFLVIIIIFFVHRPQGQKINNAQRQLINLQAQLVSQRQNIEELKKLEFSGRIMQLAEVSQAIDEITEQGMAFGLKFISITPKQICDAAIGNLKMLPITFKIEGGYEDLGEFFVFLDEFSRSMVEISGLSVRPQEQDAANLNVELEANIYLEAEDAK